MSPRARVVELLARLTSEGHAKEISRDIQFDRLRGAFEKGK
jgi:hypothetical protein